MDFGFLSVVAVVVLIGTGLAREVVAEYFANVAVQQDYGVAGNNPPPREAAAKADAASLPPVPVLMSAPISATPATPLAPPMQTAAPMPPPAAPVETQNLGLAHPSTELLTVSGDAPMKRPDGSVFLPISLQRLIGLRTEITQLEEVTPSLSIPGRVVTSRDVGALVQAKQSGIVEPVDANVPVVGTHVIQGTVLVTIRPVIDVTRRAELVAKAAELENLIQMGTQRILRLQEVNFIRYRESKVNAVAAEIEGYRRQLQIYRGLLDDVTEIRAQSSGVISRVGFVAGQIVEPQTVLFEIVDPSRLWVEATAYDTTLVTGLEGAHAVATDGKVLALRFIGGGLSLQGQALPLDFEIVGAPADLQVGRGVTVVVPRPHGRTKGIRLPVTALVENAGGETTVWQRLAAETFVSRTVTVAPLDGSTVLVTTGLSPDMRIVTADPAILSQVR